MNKIKILILLCFLLGGLNKILADDWKFITQLDGSLLELESIDSTHSYIIGGSSLEPRLYKTRDGGKSWEELYTYHSHEQKPPLQLMINAYRMEVPDTNTIYIIFTSKVKNMLKSTDGGKTFKVIEVDVEGESYFDLLTMYDKNIGFVRWTNSASYMTDDGWETTRKMPEDLFQYKKLKHEPIFLDSNTMLIFLNPVIKGEGDLVVKYKIKEHTQEILYKFKPEDSFWIAEVEYINDNLVYLAGGKDNGVGDQSRDIVWKGTQGLTHWEEVLSKEEKPIFGLHDISFYDKNNGIVTGAWGKIALTNDGGKTWKYDTYSSIYDDELPYGPPTLHVKWAGKRIIIGSNNAKMYEYSGNYFKFEQSEPFYFTMSGTDKYCFNTPMFELELLEPNGGEYTGEGIHNNRLNCAEAGDGEHQITYSYTDENELTKDTTITIEIFSYIEAPVINQSKDTLSTQYNKVSWYAEADKDIELSKSKIYIPITEGYYLAKYTDVNKCEELSERHYYSPNSVYTTKNSEIKIEDEVLKISQGLLPRLRSIKIYNLKGEIVMSPKPSKNVNLQELNKGIYTIQLLGSTEIEYMKFIK